MDKITKLHAFSEGQRDQFSSIPNKGNFDSDVNLEKNHSENLNVSLYLSHLQTMNLDSVEFIDFHLFYISKLPMII